jgi:hypothetical protein
LPIRSTAWSLPAGAGDFERAKNPQSSPLIYFSDRGGLWCPNRNPGRVHRVSFPGRPSSATRCQVNSVTACDEFVALASAK